MDAMSGGADNPVSSKVPRADGDTDVAKRGKDGAEEGRRLRSRNAPSENLPVVNYKEGEPLDLTKYFNSKTGQGRSVKVVIPAEALSHSNRQVQSRQLWGSDIYTGDSDLVAILMHAGFYSHSLSAPPASVTEAHVVVTTLPVEKLYPAASRNNIRSRTWCGGLEGCSIKVDGCWLVTQGGETVTLQAAQDGLPAIAPTFMPAAMERTVHTRSSGSLADRRQRMKQEVTIQYNLCNEPWLKYNMGAVADQGLHPSQWTSARLHSETLFLETHSTRYELSWLDTGVADAEGTQVSQQEEQFRWARCHKPLSLAQLKRSGVPLKESMIDIIEPSLPWEDFQWSPSGLYVKGLHYPMVRLHFMRMTSTGQELKEQAA